MATRSARLKIVLPPDVPAGSQLVFHFAEGPLDVEIPVARLSPSGPGSVETAMEVPAEAKTVSVSLRHPERKSSNTPPVSLDAIVTLAPLQAVPRARPRTTLPAARPAPKMGPFPPRPSPPEEMLGPPRGRM